MSKLSIIVFAVAALLIAFTLFSLIFAFLSALLHAEYTYQLFPLYIRSVPFLSLSST